MLLALAAQFPCAVQAMEFQVRTKVVVPPEMSRLTLYEVQCGKERYSLVPPQNWQAEVSTAPRTLRFRDPGRSATLEAAWSAPDVTEERALEAMFQDLGITNSKEAVGQRFETVTGVGAGVAVDLAWTYRGTSMRGHCVFVPRASGGIRFLLTCQSGDFARLRRTLSGMMNSCQAITAQASSP